MANVAALNAGDVATLETLYTDDAIQLPPTSSPIVGRDASRSAIATELDGVTVEADIDILERVATGDWAFARGTYRTVVEVRDGSRSGRNGELARHSPSPARRVVADRPVDVD